MIKSKFYLIRGDGIPIYVGFTNRPIKQRFTEHKADKDFSDYTKITVEKLDELDYEFTWDESILYKNANEVSVREAQLIIEYNTQDSKYQKAIGGGQVWSYEKWFVSTNKNNPKFRGMSGKEIEEYIQSEREAGMYISHFISHMLDPAELYMSDFVNNMKSPAEQYMSDFVNNMKEFTDLYMAHFVSGMIEPAELYMQSFVYTMKNPIDVYMKNFVNHMIDPTEQYIISFVGNMNKKDKYDDRY